MKILVIDDVRIMDFECEYARNSDDGAKMLAYRAWDEVWFDHDLGDDDTTRPIVTAMEYCKEMKMRLPTIGKCIVHSSNGPGRDWLVAGLKNCGYDVYVTNPPVIGHIDA